MTAYDVNTRYSVSANALIFNDQGEVLLSHRTDKDRWNFPGGAMELGETPVEAVIRETKEEIGVDIEVVRLLGIYTKPTEADVVFAFLCRIVSGTPTTSSEADRNEYFSPDKLPQNMSEYQIMRIHDAVKNNGDLIFKKQLSN